MNQLSVRDLEQHVPVLGWLLIVSHAVFLLIGAFVFALLTGIGAMSGEGDAFAILALVGTIVGVIMVVLALPGMLAGYGLLKRQPWGRVLAIIVAALNLANFPVGTLIALYTLWVLFQQAAGDYFTPGRPVAARI